MVGQVLGAVSALPDIYTEITISFFLLRRLLGVKTEGDKKGAKVKIITCIVFFVQGEDVKKYLFGLWSNSNKLYTCLISHWMKKYGCSVSKIYLEFTGPEIVKE